MRKKKLQERLPEIVFSSADAYTTKQIAKFVKAELLRKLIPKVYTSNNLEEDRIIVQKNIWMLIPEKTTTMKESKTKITSPQSIEDFAKDVEEFATTKASKEDLVYLETEISAMVESLEEWKANQLDTTTKKKDTK